MSNILEMKTPEQMEAARLRNRKWRDSFPAGACRSCGKQREPGKNSCRGCLDRANARRALVADGFCTQCSSAKAIEGLKWCQGCQGRNKRYRESGKRIRKEYRADGRATFCAKCLSERLIHESCFSCAKTNAKKYRSLHKEVYGRSSRKRLAIYQSLGSHTRKEWDAILEKHGHRCAECGSKSNITKDHKIPLSKGGSNFAYNLQPLCFSCNSRKQAKLYDKFQFSLFDRVPS